MYQCESWTIKKAEHWRIDAFELRFWRRVLRVPWTAKRSNKSILKEICPEYSLKGLTLKLQYFGHLMWSLWLIGKDLITRKDWRQEEKGMTEDEMVGWHHWLNGHEFEQTLGDGERQGSLACCSPWGCKEFAKTEWLNNKYREWRGESCVSRFKKLWVEEEISVAQSLSYLLPTWCEVRVGGYAK